MMYIIYNPSTVTLLLPLHTFCSTVCIKRYYDNNSLVYKSTLRLSTFEKMKLQVIVLLLSYVASSQSNDCTCSYAGIMVMTKDVVSCDVHVTACALVFCVYDVKIDFAFPGMLSNDTC